MKIKGQTYKLAFQQPVYIVCLSLHSHFIFSLLVFFRNEVKWNDNCASDFMVELIKIFAEKPLWYLNQHFLTLERHRLVVFAHLGVFYVSKHKTLLGYNIPTIDIIYLILGYTVLKFLDHEIIKQLKVTYAKQELIYFRIKLKFSLSLFNSLPSELMPCRILFLAPIISSMILLQYLYIECFIFFAKKNLCIICSFFLKLKSAKECGHL